MKKTIVIAGVILHDETILIARRAPGMHFSGVWEFPGGKLEANESHSACLVREMKEELSISGETRELIYANEHTYPDRIISLFVYFFEWLSGDIMLTVHDKMQWVTKYELGNYIFPPGNTPVLEKLKELL